MMLQNHTSRYHVAESTVRGAAKFNDKVQVISHEVIAELKHMAEKDREFIYKNGAGKSRCLYAPLSPTTDSSLLHRSRGHLRRPEVQLSLASTFDCTGSRAYVITGKLYHYTLLAFTWLCLVSYPQSLL